MEIWGVKFQTLRPMASLPRLITIVSEARCDASYLHEGRFRQGESHCLFQYTLEGEGRFRNASGEHILPAGAGFLCRIRDPRTAYFYPPGGRTPWQFVYACFDGAAADAIVTEMVGRYGPVYTLPADGAAASALLSWKQQDGATRILSAAEGARVVMDLLTALAERKELRLPEDPANALVLRAQRLVRANLHRPLNVSDLAEALDVSREHLTRLFRERTHQTPYRFIRREKMLLACRLLKDTSLTQKQIASRLGFGAAAHFSRTFRQVMRITPGRFRAVGVIPPQ